MKRTIMTPHRLIVPLLLAILCISAQGAPGPGD
jgi:hypothetical protein